MIRWSLLLVGCLLSCTGTAPVSESWRMHSIDHTSSGADGTKLADVNGDGLLDIVTGWEQGNVARLYFHPGNPLEEWTYVEVPAPDVEDALPVDLDQDGFYDLVTCSEGAHMRVTFHWAPAGTGAYSQSDQWESVDVPATVGKTRWMFVQAMEIDGKNGIDLIVGSKDPNGTLGWLEAPENPRDMQGWQYHEIAPANWIMSIEVLDIDQDGLQDLLVSDRNGPHRGIHWFQNPGSDAPALRGQWASFPIGMTDADPLFLDVADSNGDGRIEIWAPNLHEYFMYFEQMNAAGTKWRAEKWIIPEMAGLIGKSAAIGDINQDGHPDLVTTYDGATARSGVIWSAFDATSKQWTHHDVSGEEGIKYDFASLIDIDGDGDLDILTSEEANNSQQGPGLGVIWYENPIQPVKP